MGEIAFFPGRFQPPHLGHITTIMNMYDKYDKIIVGITEGKPSILSVDKVYDMLNNIFKHLPKIELCKIKHTLDDGSAVPYVPKGWDVLLTGNKLVLGIAEKYGWKAEFIPRSHGIGFSGSDLRQLYG